ncbi:MAG: ankyrin repeat domain-containing protein [Treponema sp.]|jgi:transcriptional regulator with XRE-family HTH domain|nr:ankyrin repeat domain-containing protein [Treponema sp.]
MENNVMNNVRANIRRLREKLGMSQDDIAERLHTARPVISNWERGTSEPSSSQIFKLAQIFGVSVDALFLLGGKSKIVIVFDTSALIKRPAIIKETLEKFDEVIIPRVVIDELNNQKDDKTKAWLKQRAWYVMCIIDELREKNKKLIIVEPKKQSGKNDERIAEVAIDRASQSITDRVYMFAHDVYFPFLVKEKHSNLYLLTFDEYTRTFSEEKDYDIAKTQDFFSCLKNREFDKLKNQPYDPEIDINFIDSETGYTPLVQALRLKNIAVINDLLEKYRAAIDTDKHDKHKYGFTPLLHAAQMQNIELMKLLVKAGADVDVGSNGDNSGNTPLMVCAWHGFEDGVAFLVAQGASFNMQDSNGFTALTKACIKGFPNIVKMLIDKTDLNIRSRENKKAVEYVKPNKKNSVEIYQLFKEVEQ